MKKNLNPLVLMRILFTFIWVPANIFGADLTPPNWMGSVGESYPPSSSHPPKVIVIEEPSNHPDIQKNITYLLEHFHQTLPAKTSQWPFVIATEGGTGRFDASLVIDFPDDMTRRQALDMLRQEGRLSGLEHFAVRYKMLKQIFGVEDAQQYETYQSLFQKTFTTRKQLLSQLKAIEKQMRVFHPRVYPKPLQDLQAQWNDYETDKIKQETYLRFLLKQAQHTKAMNAFWGPYQKNPVLILKRYPKERILEETLRLHERVKWMIGKQFAATSLLASSEPKTFSLSKATQKNRSPLLSFLQLERDLQTLIRIANYQATRQEWFDLKPRTSFFVSQMRALFKEQPGVLNLEAAELFNATHTALGSLPQLITTSLDYYQLALARSKPMANNTLALLSVSGHSKRPSTAILIVNPFQAKGVTQELQRRRVSYLLVRPLSTRPALKKELRASDIYTTLQQTKRLARPVPNSPTPPRLLKVSPVRTKVQNLSVLPLATVRQWGPTPTVEWKPSEAPPATKAQIQASEKRTSQPILF